MPQIAFVGVAMLGLAALHGAAAHHLASVQERAGFRIVELQRGALAKMAVLVQLLDELLADQLMHALRVAQPRPLVNGKADVVGIERRLLRLVVLANVLLYGAVELPGLHQLAVALVDGRAEAVRSADEPDVGGADAIAQEAGARVGRDEHARDVAEVQRLVAVRHAGRDDGPLRPRGTLDVTGRCCHRSQTPSKRRQSRRRTGSCFRS